MSIALVKDKVSRWRSDHVAMIADYPDQTIPRVSNAHVSPIVEGLDLWDMWPLQTVDGATANFDGWTVWFILSAPKLPDPDLRHGVARIRLMTEREGMWVDCGTALPDGLNPGSREWAGSALYEPELERVTLFYTVAGLRGEAETSFAQRLFQTRGQLEMVEGQARISGWSEPKESVQSDDHHYVVVNQTEGVPGFIKGFRDPAHFRDPATGQDYLLFTASLKQSVSDWNGCVGIARATDADHDAWDLLPPIITADGLNNEQERPLVICRDGRYYLFWSTQRKVFEPHGPNGPNGIYGMVAPSLFGPYEPLNGTGLVAANPPEEPYQTYSWWITQDLDVMGFVDLIGVGDAAVVDDPAWRRAHFGGVPAPRFRLVLAGETACVERY